MERRRRCRKHTDSYYRHVHPFKTENSSAFYLSHSPRPRRGFSLLRFLRSTPESWLQSWLGQLEEIKWKEMWQSHRVAVSDINFFTSLAMMFHTSAGTTSLSHTDSSEYNKSSRKTNGRLNQMETIKYVTISWIWRGAMAVASWSSSSQARRWEWSVRVAAALVTTPTTEMRKTKT